MKTIGITGNIGSGKTTVAKLFEEKGIPVFYSDLVAREAESVPEIHDEFIKILGEEILFEGEIDRTKMRAIVFNNKDILAKVNNLITPYVITRFQEFVVANEKLGYEFVMLESAILFESKADKNFDYIISVIADKYTRARRVMERDNLTLDLVIAKMNNQLSDDFKAKNSNFIIINENLYDCDIKVILMKQIELILLAIPSEY